MPAANVAFEMTVGGVDGEKAVLVTVTGPSWRNRAAWLPLNGATPPPVGAKVRVEWDDFKEELATKKVRAVRKRVESK